MEEKELKKSSEESLAEISKDIKEIRHCYKFFLWVVVAYIIIKGAEIAIMVNKYGSGFWDLLLP